MRKIKNPYLGKEGYDCFGCCPDNPIGLHLEFYEDGDDVVAYWRPQEHFQGWVGVLHGGIQATLLDEIACWVVARKLQVIGVTSRLNVRYLHPVSSESSCLTLRARITEQKRSMVFISAELLDDQQNVCTDAEIVYYAYSEEKSREMGLGPCGVEDEQLFAL